MECAVKKTLRPGILCTLSVRNIIGACIRRGGAATETWPFLLVIVDNNTIIT